MRAEPDKPRLPRGVTDLALGTRPLVTGYKRIQVGNFHLSFPGGSPWDLGIG